MRREIKFVPRPPSEPLDPRRVERNPPTLASCAEKAETGSVVDVIKLFLEEI